MKRSKKILYLSLLISLPINIFVLFAIFETMEAYHIQDRYSQNLPKGLRFKSVGDSVIKDLKYRVYHLLGIKKKSDVNLVLPPKSIKELSENLPKSGNSYKKDAVLITKNRVTIGKAKLRGDFFYHWALPRKSWRFSALKKNASNARRKVNFIIPKHESQLSNHMSYLLAKELGLLAPDSKLVDFSVNGVYKGVRLMVDQIDESFLRKNKIVPGDIYKGDNIGRKEYIGVEASIFENASIWEKASYNNHYSKDSKKPLFRFLKGLSKGQIKKQEIKSFAKMAALIDLTSTYHIDNRHNWVLYYDHYLENITPIIWDVNGWFPEDVKRGNLNIITSKLFDKLYQNYDFLREKIHIFNLFFHQKEQAFRQTLYENIETAKEFVNRNGYTFTLGSFLLTKQQALKTIDAFQNSIESQLAKNKNYFLGSVNKDLYKYALFDNKISLQMSGSKLVKSVIIKLNVNKQPKQVFLSFKQANKTITHSLINNTEIKNNEIIVNVELLSKVRLLSIENDTKIEFEKMTYDLNLQDIIAKDIDGIWLKFENYNQETIKIKQVETIKPINLDKVYLNVIDNTAKTKTLTWSGEKHFTGDTIIKDNIIIAPGTKLVFSQESTLKVLGKVTAIGTKEKPIIFEPLAAEKPWGAFVLKDQGSNDSVFKHVIFKGGSGNKSNFHEYTAMFSVHNVQDLVVEDSFFHDNKLTDDMVHVVYSQVTFRRTQFFNSRADALDADISDVTIDNCQFKNSGNDAIDLMTSKAKILNSKFSFSGDKAISIGEGSKLLAINNLFENNSIALQSKDQSIAYVFNTSLINNKKAVDAYHKNWRYSEGGFISINNCIMKNNTENATVGKKSTIEINHCLIDDKNNFSSKSLKSGKIKITEDETIKSRFDDDVFKIADTILATKVVGYYEKQ